MSIADMLPGIGDAPTKPPKKVGRAGALLDCPDRSGKRCEHYVATGRCSLEAHPCCELWVVANPGRSTGDDAIDRFLDRWPNYRQDVEDGRWFSDGWSDRARMMIHRDHEAAERARVERDASARGASPEAIAEARRLHQRQLERRLEIARETPDRLMLLDRGAFRRYPLRRSDGVKGLRCAACDDEIGRGQDFYDGGEDGARAHRSCVEGAPAQVALVGYPSDDDIADLIACGKQIRISGPEFGDLWIVPELTPGRNEMTWRQFRTMCMMLAQFPGTRIEHVSEFRAAGAPFLARCSCAPGHRPNAACPVGLALGKHEAGDHAHLECECEAGWNEESRRTRCQVGRAFGNHQPSDRAEKP